MKDTVEKNASIVFEKSSIEEQKKKLEIILKKVNQKREEELKAMQKKAEEELKGTVKKVKDI